MEFFNKKDKNDKKESNDFKNIIINENKSKLEKVSISLKNNNLSFNIKKCFYNKKIIAPLKGHKYDVCSLSILNDDKYIVSDSSDNTIKIYDFKNVKIHYQILGIIILKLKKYFIFF